MPVRPAPIDLHVTYTSQGAVLEVGGEVDALNAHRLRAAIHAAIAVGATDLTFDCTDLLFMDSSGLAVLAATAQEVEAQGGRATVTHPSPALVRLLAVTGLDEVLAVQGAPQRVDREAVARR